MAKSKPFEENLERYEAWFERNAFAYRSELDAVRALLPEEGTGMEIGVGSGRFAEPLGIRFGVEPSAGMRKVAGARGIEAVDGVAERLPYPDSSFDFALMVTTICFLDDVAAALREAHRVIRPGGAILIGFVDRESALGKSYLKHKDENPFYREAEFFSTEEVSRHLEEAGFRDLAFRQTVFREPGAMAEVEAPREGYGEGSFVVVRGVKP
jgi:SAM-dependent methyltransferase